MFLFMIKRNMLMAACAALVFMALPSSVHAQDKDSVLRKLDAAAKSFRSTAAEFEFDTVTTEPIEEKEVQKGVVYYERKGTAFQMAAHIREVNGKKAAKTYVYSGGAIRLFEPGVNQVTTLNKLGQYESWFMLGFGASGHDLEQKWEIKYVGPEVLDGRKAERLEMIPKDAAVRRNLPKVKVWVDPETGVSLKQVFDQGQGQYRVSVYFNIKVNQPLPSEAFKLETNSKTTYVTR